MEAKLTEILKRLDRIETLLQKEEDEKNTGKEHVELMKEVFQASTQPGIEYTRRLELSELHQRLTNNRPWCTDPCKCMDSEPLAIYMHLYSNVSPGVANEK